MPNHHVSKLRPRHSINTITSPFQKHATRECLLALEHRPEKSFRQARLGDVDLDNSVLRQVVKDIEHFFAKVLTTSAQQTGKLKLLPAKCSLVSFKCAHDTVRDPSTEEKLAPHLIADCTALCNAMADAIVKQRLGDVEQAPYEVTAANAQKSAKRAQARLKKAEQAEAKTKSKADASAKKLKSATNAKAATKMQKAADKAAKAYIKAQNAHKDAKAAAQQFETDASNAIANYAKVIQAQSDILQSWYGVISTLKSYKSLVMPACVESVLLFLLPCSKGKDQQTCTLGHRRLKYGEF